MHRRLLSLTLVLGCACAAPALAQSSAQVVKPPVAQAWIDIATFSGMGMPMGMGAGGASPMNALGGLFGGGAGAGQNRFGNTQAMAAGRWVDVTLMTRTNPQLAEAQQIVPAGFLSPPLKLQSPKEARGAAPDPGDDRVVEEREQERPKGKLLMYWGCGETVRAGQPLVVDFATASAADLARAFQSRRATQRGAHSAQGRPAWPSAVDARMVPAQASLIGEHVFSGQGVPEGFRFQIPAQQDLMPPVALKQQQQANGATLLEWQTLATARAYFAAAMGGRGQNEMVVWSSSELPDMGLGLLDYQTNAAVDRWLGEKVLLAPQTTRCAVPKGVFGGDGAMLRLIAYGSELNLAQPPRPADPKVAWEPVWTAKLRVKSVAMAMLGMDMGDMGAPRQEPPPGSPAEVPPPTQPKLPGVADVLKGILGR